MSSSVPPQSKATHARLRHLNETLRTAKLCAFLYKAIAHEMERQSDAFVQRKAKDLSGVPGQEELERKLILAADEFEAPFRQHEALMAELVLRFAVENYLAYLSELLALIYRTKPDALKSEERVTFEFVLSHQTLDDLILALAQRKVDELSFAGMKELSNHFSKRLGLSLTKSEPDQRRLVELTEARNVIVHNRGRVSPTYRDRVPWSTLEIGDEIPLKLTPDVREALEFLNEIARDLDRAAMDKFNLQG